MLKGIIFFTSVVIASNGYAQSTSCGGVVHPNISPNDNDYGLVPDQYSAVCEIKTNGIGSGFVQENLTLTSDILWVLSGAVNIGLSISGGAQNPLNAIEDTDAAVLTIEQGTTIIGDFEPGDPLSELDYLVVNRGSKIVANGSDTAPIRFTSRQGLLEGSEATGEWGGIIVNGYAPINNCSEGSVVLDCERAAPFGGGQFGGNDISDSSGELSFVRIENAGFELSPESGFDALSLNGIGNSTKIEFVQVHRSQRNGINMLGGDVKLERIVLTNNKRNGLNWNNGWLGSAQKLLISNVETAHSAINGSSNEQNIEALPKSDPAIINSTIIHSETGTVVNLEGGTGAKVYAQIISSPTGNCYSHDQVDETDLLIGFSRVDCGSIGSSSFETDWFEDGDNNNSQTDIDLNGYINSRLLSSASLFNFPQLEDVSRPQFIGAVGYCVEDWTEGWAIDLPVIDPELCVDPSLNVPIGNLISYVLPVVMFSIAAKS